MDFITRLKTVIEYSKLSERAFALKCGLKQPTLDKQLKGLRSVSLETLIGIANRFPEFSRDWLLMGEGDMLKSQSKEAERISKLIDTISTLQDTINAKSEIIDLLKERINKLEQQLK